MQETQWPLAKAVSVEALQRWINIYDFGDMKQHTPAFFTSNGAQQTAGPDVTRMQVN